MRKNYSVYSPILPVSWIHGKSILLKESINSLNNITIMQPGYARIVYCPYCGEKKELLSLMSGNTIGARYWSDLRMRAPMLPEVSPVQKCHHCGKYYLQYKQKSEHGEKPSLEQGELSYPEWKEAYTQFMNERENRNPIQKVDEKDIDMIRLRLIQAYNDYYYRDCVAEFSEEEWGYISNVIWDFIGSKNKPDNLHPLLIPELLREIGMLCEDFFESECFENLEGFDKIYYDGIRKRMEVDDTEVFEIII